MHFSLNFLIFLKNSLLVNVTSNSNVSRSSGNVTRFGHFTKCRALVALDTTKSRDKAEENCFFPSSADICLPQNGPMLALTTHKTNANIKTLAATSLRSKRVSDNSSFRPMSFMLRLYLPIKTIY